MNLDDAILKLISSGTESHVHVSESRTYWKGIIETDDFPFYISINDKCYTGKSFDECFRKLDAEHKIESILFRKF